MVHSGFHSWILSHISNIFAYDFMYVMGTFSSGSLNPRSLSQAWSLSIIYSEISVWALSLLFSHVIMYEISISQLGCLSTYLSHLNTLFLFHRSREAILIIVPEHTNAAVLNCGLSPLGGSVEWPFHRGHVSDTLHIRYQIHHNS